MHAVKSDRKLKPEQYVQARPAYLTAERYFLRMIGIIRCKPNDYDDHLYDENWDNIAFGWQHGIWDGERTLNVDEVPWTMDIEGQQLHVPGECCAVSSDVLQYLGKYRQGTLTLVTNYKEILFIVIIFMNGGKRVERKLRNMDGNIGSNVMYAVTKSGSMNSRVWKALMKRLMTRTMEIRGCRDVTGEDWTKPVVMYMDNYGPHLRRDVAKKYAVKYGIFLRCLMKNGSHLQQPVDQHVGYFIKRLVLKLLSRWFSQLERAAALGKQLSIDLQRWREITAGLVGRAMRLIGNDRYRGLLINAWVNFGLYLPLDGSIDGEIDTLHVNGVQKNMSDKKEQKYLEVKIRRVSRQKRSHYAKSVWDAYDFEALANAYCLVSAQHNAAAVETDTIGQEMIKMDLKERYSAQIQKYVDEHNFDLSDIRNKIPQLKNVLTSLEVEAVKKMYYDAFGDEGVRWLFLRYLKIPIRDSMGYIKYEPLKEHDDDRDSCSNSTLSYRDRVIIESTSNDFHNHFACTNVLVSVNLQHLIAGGIEEKFDVPLLNSHQILQKSREENWHYQKAYGYKQYVQESREDQYVRIQGWSGLAPGASVAFEAEFGFNWARECGGTVGMSQVSYTNWHNAFVNCVQTSEGFQDTNINQEVRSSQNGIWEYLNDTVADRVGIDRIVIGPNANNRCWFLCWIYLFIGVDDLIHDLQSENHDGDVLMRKLLEIIKYSMLQSQRRPILLATYFIEALLIGHLNHWSVYGDINTAFKMLCTMSSRFKRFLAIDFIQYSYCEDHGSFAEQHLTNTPILKFNFDVEFDVDAGIFIQSASIPDDCSECGWADNKKNYWIENDVDDYFCIYFENGVPQTLWSLVKRGCQMKVGRAIRGVWSGIFRLDGNHFVAAHLITDHRQNVVNFARMWLYLDTLSKKVVRGYNLSRLDCKVLLFQPPLKSCTICNDYDDEEHLMVQCPNCSTWHHQSCVHVSLEMECQHNECISNRL